MEGADIIYEFGLATDLFWDPLGETEVNAAVESGFSFLEIWGHVPWFDIYSSSMAADYRQLAESAGLRIRSVHAPCEADWDISSEDEDVRLKSVEEVGLAMQRCREMGGELVVIHPGRRLVATGSEEDAEHQRRVENSIRSFESISEAARSTGILMAVENQWANEVGGKEKFFFQVLDTLDPSITGVCFDSSHANITPGTHEMIERLTHPIITTHLSDNHGQYDEHKPPFTASIDWKRTLALLLDKGYRGPWLMEVTNGGHDPYGVLEAMSKSIEEMKAVLEELSCR